MRAVVEQVIQTASKVLEGELEGREAVTILATLSRDAGTAAEALRRTEPERAATYRTLLGAIIQELETRSDSGADVATTPGGGRQDERSRYLSAVAQDLAKVQRSLADS